MRTEPKRSIRLPRKLWLVVVVVVVGVALWAQNSTVLVPDMQSYAVIDQRTISVRVAVAPCSWTRVTNVAETKASVQVKVETLPCPIPLPGTAELDFRDLTVGLSDDFAARVVEDADGQPVPRAVAWRSRRTPSMSVDALPIGVGSV